MKNILLTIIHYIRCLFSYNDYHIAARKVTWYGFHTVKSKTFKAPTDSRDVTIDIEYYFNNKKYRYMTTDPKYTWPPENKDNGGVEFRLPIKSVFTLDDDDKPDEDVTELYKDYSGPKGTTKFPMRKVFPFENKLKVTNIMGQSSIVALLSEKELKVA